MFVVTSPETTCNQINETMPVVYYALQMNPVILLVVIIGLFVLFSTGLTLLFKRYGRINIRHSDNGGLGDVFVAITAIYGLLMGFVVFLVWDSFNTAQTNADREGSLARSLYRDIYYYPDSAKIAPLMSAYIDYVHYVIEYEYSHMEKIQPTSSEDRYAFSKVFSTIERDKSNDYRMEEIFKTLNELATYRSLRQLDAVNNIPYPIWMTLMLGGILIIGFATVLEFKNLNLHLIINGLLGAFIGLLVYIIVLLDYPFTGSISIKPEAYQQILLMHKETHQKSF